MRAYEKKEWFVIMWEHEIKAFKTANQWAVYSAIKSFCANGRNEVGLSDREIAYRAVVSDSTVLRTIPGLIDLGLLKITGGSTRRGGTVKVYKVLQPEAVNGGKCFNQKQLKDLSASGRRESASGLGTIPPQSNKVNNKEKKFSPFLLETVEEKIRALEIARSF